MGRGSVEAARQHQGFDQQNVGTFVERLAPDAQLGKAGCTRRIVHGNRLLRVLPNARCEKAGDALAFDEQPGRERRAALRFDAFQQRAGFFDIEVRFAPAKNTRASRAQA